MGYRSDLVVLIYPDVETAADMAPKYEQLKLLMGTTFKDVVDEFFGSCMTWMDSEHVLKFDLPDVKWYPSYADVQMFEKMLSAFKCYDEDNQDDIKGYCTEFIRVGEESDDVEEVHTGHNNHYYLSVRREIDCNV
jgi:hypothetical protein